MRKTLDHLMGADRDLPLKEKLAKKMHFDSPEVCKFFLIGFCPHSLFRNTKSALKECKRRHDQHFKDEFERDPDKEYYQKKYEDSLLDFLEELIREVDNKMKRCVERIEAPIPEQDLNNEVKEKVKILEDKVKELVEQAESFQKLGLLEDCEITMKNIEKLNAEKENLLTLKEHPLMVREKQMKICEVCGALQSAVDNDKRLQTHVEGKLHSGYLKIREYLALLRRRRLDRKLKNAEEKEKEKWQKEMREKEEGRERSRRNEKDSRDRYHSKGYHSKDRNYERNGSHRRDNHRDKYERTERERYKTERERSKHRRSRERSRSRDNYRERSHSGKDNHYRRK